MASHAFDLKSFSFFYKYSFSIDVPSLGSGVNFGVVCQGGMDIAFSVQVPIGHLIYQSILDGIRARGKDISGTSMILNLQNLMGSFCISFCEEKNLEHSFKLKKNFFRLFFYPIFSIFILFYFSYSIS
jgi:hypothetical protein